MKQFFSKIRVTTYLIGLCDLLVNEISVLVKAKVSSFYLMNCVHYEFSSIELAAHEFTDTTRSGPIKKGGYRMKILNTVMIVLLFHSVGALADANWMEDVFTGRSHYSQ